MTAVDRPARGSGSGVTEPADCVDADADAAVDAVDSVDSVDDDRALLQRLRAGEDAAFGQLFARHSAAVRRLAYGLVNDRSEAEDLTAEAFFRVLQAIRRGSGPVDNVRGYLLIVARRVAWEWHSRRRDVPVSDEELNHRAGVDPDTAGQSTERNLITRAFTSLPERWRSVLWKVEVEGERPAVVAINFGLSANATAALARRARQGLRAAYLQAHLAAERSSTGCRWVLEKLGAYTAGSIRGSERRRIRAHLSGCASCASMHAELRDVCSGLRAHAAYVAVPLAVVGYQAAATGCSALAASGGVGATVKGLLAGAKAQVALAASSAAAIGVLGMVAIPWGSAHPVSLEDLDGHRGLELVITGAQPADTTSQTIALTTGALSTVAVVPGRGRRGARGPDGTPNPPGAGSAPGDGLLVVTSTSGVEQDAQVIYRETSVQERSELFDDHAVVYQTTLVTVVDSADRTATYTQTTRYTKPLPPGGAPPGPKGSGTATAPQSPAMTGDSSSSNTVVSTTASEAPRKAGQPPGGEPGAR